MLEFQWNPSKARANLRKHGVSFEEALTVFHDVYASQYVDDEHPGDENRFILLGMSARSRVLAVCHCERANGEVVRIISARKATAKERSSYRGIS
jgi:uncharacterized DUF497 family protein